MKKIILSVMSALILFNFGIGAFANSDFIEGDLNNEIEFIPSVYDNSNYYNTRSTLALGSLGLSTAGGTAILGGLASVVGPILGALALVGGAIVVGQGLVNIYDYLQGYALTKDEAEKLDVKANVTSKGKVHLQLVKKNPVTNKPEPYKPNDPIIKDIGFSFAKHQTTTNVKTEFDYPLIKYNPDMFSIASDGRDNPQIFTSSGKDYQRFKGVLKNKFLVIESNGYIHYTNFMYLYSPHTSSSTYEIQNTSTYASGIEYKKILNYVAFSQNIDTGELITNDITTSEKYNIPYNINWNSGFVRRKPYICESKPCDVFAPYFSYGYNLIDSSFVQSIIQNNSLQHPQLEFIIDEDIIKNLNPDISFDFSEGIYKNPVGDPVSPDDLIIPMPDTMTDTEINYSLDIDNVIRPEGDKVPSPNPSPESSPDSNLDSNGWLDKFWNWVNNYWQKFVELMMSLFVPNSNYFSDKFANINNLFSSKFPIFNQIGTFFSKFNFDYEPKAPEFKITLPKVWGGETYIIIDFSTFNQYRPLLLNFVRLFLWFPFLKRLYRRLPNLINGGGSL